MYCFRKEIKHITNIIIISIISVVIMIFFGISYETNDDWAIAWQLSGRDDGLSTFLSPFLSKIIAFFYRYRDISWWLLFTLFLISCCLFTIYYYISTKYQGTIKWILLIISFFCVWISSIQNVNFTRTAILVTICGCLWVAEYMDIGANIRLLLGVLLIVTGAMIRYQAALAVMPIFIISLFVIWRNNLRVKLRIINAMVLIIALLMLLEMANGLYWKGMPEWEKYLEYNYQRGMIQDYKERFPKWEEGSKEYRNIGFLPGDEQMILQEWFSEDTDVFSLEHLSKMLELKDNSLKLKDGLVFFSESLVGVPTFGIYLMIAILLLYKASPKSKIYMLILTTYILILILFFSLKGRILERVSEPLIMSGVFFGIWIGGREHLNFKNGVFLEINNLVTLKKYRVYLTTCILVSFSFIIFGKDLISIPKTFSIPHIDNGMDENARQEMDYMNKNVDNIYILPATVHNWDKSFGIWERIRKGYCDNVFFLGGWEARAPYNVKKLKKLGIENPAKSLVELPNVYSAYSDMVWLYLKKHYGDEITCSRIDSFHGVNDNSVVKYTLPVLKEDIPDKQITDIYLQQFEVQCIDQNYGRLISGNVIEKNMTELYYNVEVGPKTYTYRLKLDEEGEFYAFLYNFENIYNLGITESYLWGCFENGEKALLGYIEIN